METKTVVGLDLDGKVNGWKIVTTKKGFKDSLKKLRKVLE